MNRSRFTHWLTALGMALAFCLMAALPSSAHFTVGTEARVVHVAKATDKDGVMVYLRIPGPFAYAEALSKRQGLMDIVHAPFLTMEMMAGAPYYSLKQDEILSDRQAFAQFLAKGYEFTVNGNVVAAKPGRIAFAHKDSHAEYSDPAGAQQNLAAFEKAKAAESQAPIYVADALFDIELFLPTSSPSATISMRNILPEIAMPPTMTLENLVVDHRFDPAHSVRIRGQMIEPITLDGAWWTALGNFTWQGIIHILIGLDHVLFVVCLALAAGLSTSILWSVTGFTLGHSVTLYLGSAGLVPQGAWFIPAIETAIALSILYAAFLVFLRQRSNQKTSRMLGINLFAIAAVIGLIHGYGFSFVLGDLLGGSSQQLVLALIGFNLGVELGQLGIVLAIFALLWLTGWISEKLPKGLAYGGASAAVVMSLFWFWERAQTLASMTFG